MCADGKGLVHGGFVFGAVDYAAMLAVNDPNVVLGSAEVRFVAPVKVGETDVAVATVAESRGKKRVLDVFASVGDRKVVSGTMTAFVLEDHVLEAR
jgi:acyl-coenzyme A thioesterase PaaI-like protein